MTRSGPRRRRPRGRSGGAGTQASTPVRLLALLAALGLAPGALAQSGAGPSAGPNWAGPIGEAFFADEGMATLRPEAELSRNWDALPEEDKAQVRRDCAAMSADADDMGGAASGGMSDVDPAGTGTANAPGASAVGGPAAMAQACALVAGD